LALFSLSLATMTVPNKKKPTGIHKAASRLKSESCEKNILLKYMSHFHRAALKWRDFSNIAIVALSTFAPNNDE